MGLNEETSYKTWRPPIPLTGNGFFYGRVGSGKSWKLIAVVQYYLAQGFKIWDIFGGKRGEGPFWCFPSDEKKLWDDFSSEVNTLDLNGPKEYNVDLIYPYFHDLIPDELPEQLPRIKSYPITIFFKDITPQDISLVIGNLTATGKYVWSYITKELDDNANGEDILFLFEPKQKLAKHKETSIYRLFIKPLCDAKILSGKNDRFNFDFIESSKELDRVCVLCDDYTPEEFKLFIMGWFSRMIFSLVLNNKVHKQNIAMFREMSLFMKVQDASTEFAEQKQIFRNIISDIARYARSGFFIFGDTQSPYEVKGLIEGQDDLLCISEMPSHRDREELCEQLKKDQRISDLQIAYIATMPREKMAVIERGKKARLIKRVQPPRNKCWKQGDGNFISIYKKLINSFKHITPEKNEIEKNYKERRYEIEKQLEEQDNEDESYESEDVDEDNTEIDNETQKEKQIEKKLEEEINVVKIKHNTEANESSNKNENLQPDFKEEFKKLTEVDKPKKQKNKSNEVEKRLTTEEKEAIKKERYNQAIEKIKNGNILDII